ncbi:MAG: 4-(cytidine 5'-diphospho)-2-C-methyl-D-erythritol kinase [Campylobacterota bacterium]|nr:4-(cytidine 5'-diphospho)-2-C-methyl-D-erythritol kinase [Campylobacterota bacterium]
MKSYKAPAKVNIFLKITGKRNNYHTLLSRFMRIDHLCDTLQFVPKEQETFRIDGEFSCTTEQNTIYKAYLALLEATQSDALRKLMQSYAIKVEKQIPAFAGLGGGSSDAATYLKMCNEVLHLGFTTAELSTIGAKVGADLPFFIHGYPSANVSGIGEIVEPYEEEPLELEVITPSIEISTPAVYKTFRESFYKELDEDEYEALYHMPSRDVLERFHVNEANDLFEPAIALYPRLKDSFQHGWFFSGSGSSFFRLKEGAS